MLRKVVWISFFVLGPILCGALVPAVCVLLRTPLVVPVWERVVIFYAVPGLVIGAALFALGFLGAHIIGSKLGRKIATSAFLASAYGALSLFVSFVTMEWRLKNSYDAFENILPHSTEWAPDFSDASFKKIQLSTDKASVMSALGSPLRSFEVDGREVLTYSDIGHYQSLREKAYHQRWIILENGKVSRLLRRYLTAERDPLR